jgi:hypothetical protein
MNRNKRLLIVGTIAAVVLLAVPAFALAAVWKHGGTNVNSLVEINLTGGELFETSAGNGMNCEVKATLTTEGGSAATITAFETVKCPSGFGSFAKCELVSSQAKSLPWEVHVNTTTLTITGWRQKRVFDAGCSTSQYDKTITSMEVDLDTPSAITGMEFDGSTSGYAVIAGSFALSPSGTYGIG